MLKRQASDNHPHNRMELTHKQTFQVDTASYLLKTAARRSHAKKYSVRQADLQSVNEIMFPTTAQLPGTHHKPLAATLNLTTLMSADILQQARVE